MQLLDQVVDQKVVTVMLYWQIKLQNDWHFVLILVVLVDGNFSKLSIQYTSKDVLSLLVIHYCHDVLHHVREHNILRESGQYRKNVTIHPNQIPQLRKKKVEQTMKINDLNLSFPTFTF